MMRTLALSILLIMASNAFSQKNMIYLELLGNGGFVSVNYERQLIRQVGLSMRLGMGVSFWEPQAEEVSSEGSGCVCPDLNFPNADISIPFSLQYLLPLWNTNYLETGLGYTYQFGSVKRNENPTHVFYGNIGFRRHFGQAKRWMWKVNYTPILGMTNLKTKESRIGPWAGISVGKRF